MTVPPAPTFGHENDHSASPTTPPLGKQSFPKLAQPARLKQPDERQRHGTTAPPIGKRVQVHQTIQESILHHIRKYIKSYKEIERFEHALALGHENDRSARANARSRK